MAFKQNRNPFGRSPLNFNSPLNSFDSLVGKLMNQGKSKEAATKIAGKVANMKMKGAGSGPTAAQKARAKGSPAKQAKPDFLDLDKDGNTSESMKQAAQDKKGSPAKMHDADKVKKLKSEISILRNDPEKAVQMGLSTEGQGGIDYEAISQREDQIKAEQAKHDRKKEGKESPANLKEKTPAKLKEKSPAKLKEKSPAKLKEKSPAKLESPAEKKLVGKQKNLPEGLKKAIEAAPESPAKLAKPKKKKPPKGKIEITGKDGKPRLIDDPKKPRGRKSPAKMKDKKTGKSHAEMSGKEAHNHRMVYHVTKKPDSKKPERKPSRPEASKRVADQLNAKDPIKGSPGKMKSPMKKHHGSLRGGAGQQIKPKDPKKDGLKPGLEGKRGPRIPGHKPEKPTPRKPGGRKMEKKGLKKLGRAAVKAAIAGAAAGSIKKKTSPLNNAYENPEFFTPSKSSYGQDMDNFFNTVSSAYDQTQTDENRLERASRIEKKLENKKKDLGADFSDRQQKRLDKFSGEKTRLEGKIGRAGFNIDNLTDDQINALVTRIKNRK